MARDSSSHVPVTIKTVFISVAVGFAVGPPVYYAVIDVIRRREVKRRRLRYKQRTGQSAPFSGTQDQPLECSESERKEALRELYSSFKIGYRFSNPFEEWREQSYWEVILWKLVYTPLSGRFMYQGGKPSDPEALRQSLPTESPNFAKLFGLRDRSLKSRTATRSIEDSWDHLSDRQASSGSSSEDEDKRLVKVSDDLTFTWIGQSTSYVQLDGVSILTDPIFDERTLPTVFAPSRLCPVPCQIQDLLALDLILVSHNHPDHISVAAAKAIGDRAKWIVPLGLGRWLTGLGVSNWIEMDWWQELEIDVTRLDGSKRHVTVVCTPAMHWSARGLFDSNATLWASFVVKGAKDSFFHAGDTGYSEMYKAIGELHGPFTLSAIPIGAYQPRWHLRTHHISPWDALTLHADIRSRQSIAVHWGSWVLSDEHYLSPPRDLEQAKSDKGQTDAAFRVVRPGQTLVWERRNIR